MVNRSDIDALSHTARLAARAGDWSTVSRCARQILKRDSGAAEGHFLRGQAAKASGKFDAAERNLRRALMADGKRYDVAVELAELYVRLERNKEAVALLRLYAGALGNSPVYLGMAASAYSRMDLHAEALPLYRRACELQPGIERFLAGQAACSVFLGDIADARSIYEDLLRRNPSHQRFHYELAQLAAARDLQHVEQMKAVLTQSALPPKDNIFLYYAIGKELEDLGLWDEAYEYYERGGNAVKSVSPYDVETDIRLIDAIIETCNESWLSQAPVHQASATGHPVPIFIVGLPRTGTTLTERIVSSHSQIGSVGETFFLPRALRDAAGMRGPPNLTLETIKAFAAAAPSGLAARYLEAVDYKLGTEPMFVEKLPENFLLIGHIVLSFPRQHIVHVRRHPMDACFAMYKQSYFRYAYSLDDLGRYYVAYDRLMHHWRSLLGDRLIEVRYEDLVTRTGEEIRRLLERLGLPYEHACLDFAARDWSTRTASAVQVREKVHTRSVDRWRRFEFQLRPLRDYLEEQKIDVD